MKPNSFATDDSELTLDWLARSVGTRHASDPAHLDALVGVLMLDTGFKRFPRDIGSSDSLPFATLQYRVESAVVGEVVTAHALPEHLFERFVDAGEALIEQGATVITTSCGFLHSVQEELAAALSVPVVASALLVLPQLQKLASTKRHVGVLTFDEQALLAHPIGSQHAEHLPPDIVGIDPDSHFADVIHERSAADVSQLERDVENAAKRLAEKHPAAVILECTNLAPWRAVVERVCKVPVVDLIDVIEWELRRQHR
jgi:Asp/Glu/hydantoin racemase